MGTLRYVHEHWRTVALCFICIAAFQTIFILTNRIERSAFETSEKSPPVIIKPEGKPILPIQAIDFDELDNPQTVLGIVLPPVAGVMRPTNWNNQEIPYLKGDVLKVEGRLSYSSVTQVAILSIFSAIASGLGALPFYFVKNVGQFTMGICNSLAAGLMLSASISLLWESWDYGVFTSSMGLICGMVFIILSQRILDKYEHLKLGELEGIDARKVLLIMGVMTLHSFAEGVGMGMSFGGGRNLGIFIAIAISIHNIPEGTAIALVMVPRGVPPSLTTLWCIFSSLPQPIMAVPAFLFVEYFQAILPWGLGFAAGAMLWMVFAELLPDAVQETKDIPTVVVSVLLSITGMSFFQYLVIDSWLEE